MAKIAILNVNFYFSNNIYLFIFYELYIYITSATWTISDNIDNRPT